MHLQQAWFQPYLAHQVPISTTFLEVPQKQVGQLPDGQFPPQESARITSTSTLRIRSLFIGYVIKIMAMVLSVAFSYSVFDI